MSPAVPVVVASKAAGVTKSAGLEPLLRLTSCRAHPRFCRSAFPAERGEEILHLEHLPDQSRTRLEFAAAV